MLSGPERAIELDRQRGTSVSISKIATCCTLVLLTVALPQAGHAADPFYKGKTIVTLVSTGPGGSYDLVARTVARYLPNYIEGAPSVIVQNMPGGGGKTMSNYLYNIAPKDGTTIGILNQTVGLDQILSDNSYYNTAKFEWLGRVSTTTTLVMVYKNAPVHSLEEMKTKQTLFAGQGKSSQTYMLPMLMRTLLGFKTKVVMGYSSAPEIFAAMERGEVHGRTGDMNALVASHPQWATDGTIQFLGEFSFADKPSIPGLPLLMPMAPDAKSREILELVGSFMQFGYPYAAPPGTPADRLDTLRKALAGVLKDPAFLADMKRLRLTVDPASADYLAKIAARFANVSPDLLASMKKALEW
jgi:tripartite-type tricarboxylate transporter receptor subunit TctC